MALQPPPARLFNDGAPTSDDQAARELSDDSTAPRALAATFVIVRLKHIVCAFYFGLLGSLYVTVDATQLRTTDAYAPRLVGALTLAFALLHLHGLVLTWRPHDTRLFGSLFSCRWKWRSPVLQLATAHFLDLSAQIYQAYNMSFYLVDTRMSFVFAFVVSLCCLVTPWLLLSKNAFLRRSLLLLVDSYFGFFLSTGFPFLLLLVYTIRIVFLDRNLQNDLPTVTKTLLFHKYIVTSSPMDLVTKITIQLSSYTSVRRLFVTMRIARKGSPSPPKAPLSSPPSPPFIPWTPLRNSVDRFLKLTSTSFSPLFPSNRRFASTPASVDFSILASFQSQGGLRLVSPTFGISFHKKRRHLISYLAVNLIINTTLLSSAVVATWWRRPCPSSCLLSVAPWFDLACHCVQVDLNCALSPLGDGDTIESLLDPDEIGTDLFMLHVKRCRLVHGISLKTLQPFQNIYGIAIYFSNMTQWNLDNELALPDSLRLLHIRGSNLTQVPDVLRRVPSNLLFLRLESSPIQDLPDIFPAAWTSVSILALSDLELTNVSMAIPQSLPNLVMLELRGNRIKEISTEWQIQAMSGLSRLIFLDLSANALQDGPWMLAQADRFLDLSSNLIASVPSTVPTSLLTSRSIILDDNPLCSTTTGARGAASCQPKCARNVNRFWLATIAASGFVTPPRVPLTVTTAIFTASIDQREISMARMEKPTCAVFNDDRDITAQQFIAVAIGPANCYRRQRVFAWQQL
ncbi:unnamed protein product [Aphanomyces euteiches]